MNATSTIARATSNSNATPFISGKGAEARKSALWSVAPASYSETLGNVATCNAIRGATGPTPQGFDIKAKHTTPTHKAFAQTIATIKVEHMAGRVAARLPAGEFPKEVTDAIAKIDHARNLITLYAAPGGKLSGGKTGFRSEVQHRFIRAAEQAWSQLLGELGIGAAQVRKDTAKAKRATNKNAARGAGKSASPKTEAEALIVDAKLKTTGDVCRVVETAAATLLMLANKHAKLLPTDYGAAVQAFKTAINAATNARGEREAAASK